MKGDFSKWGLDPADNFSGVLHQQGRVLLDQDWNAAQQIQALWRETAGADVIGAGLVAVPVAAPDSLKLLTANATASGVTLTLAPGRAWVDGVLLNYDGSGPLTADYLQPPLQDPPFDATTIAAGVRDAVVLEVWDEAISAFQVPTQLLEPALGGPDTTERVKTSMALKLLRLTDDQDCAGLPLEDDFASKGRLTVVPSPTTVVPGPCPVPDSGGYTGFEHYLVRIEIAEPAAGQARFKWSVFNGGLVGRGTYSPITATTGTVTITANAPMIDLCGFSDFYLEALRFDPAYGHWRTTLTAMATRTASGVLSLTGVAGTWPAAGSGFFRLWNGIDNIIAFPTGLPMPNELHEGIRLAFDAPASGLYTPGDYWTFPARAAGTDFDPSIWPSNAPPQGVRRHRAALGVLEWQGSPPTSLSAAQIHDCRQPFLPLARQKGCCTVTVGDNRHSFGQFSSIQAAVDYLPAQGGTVCVLAGVYDESVRIQRRADIRIHGCGPRTRVRAVARDGVPLPAFLIADSTGIALEDMAIESGPRSAVQVDNSRAVEVARCLIQMRDLPTLWQAIYSRGDDVTIEHNIIEVIEPRRSEESPRLPPRALPPELPPDVGSPGAPAGVNTPPPPINPGSATRGGIQLAGGSDRVRIANNIIRGGIWNGITLGSLVEVGGSPDDDRPDRPIPPDECDPCRPGDLSERDDDVEATSFRSAGDLYDIEIVDNRITDMGLNGIGVVRHFNLTRGGGDMIVVHGLMIADNVIARCMRRDIAVRSAVMTNLIGYGGISLAAVADLRILRNEIVYNGARHRFPICGVYALLVQGLQVDDNRIVNNGARDTEETSATQPGIRGGVHVWLVMPTIEPYAGSKLASTHYAASHVSTAAAVGRTPLRTGTSAAVIRDNVIIAPVGRSLTFFAIGPVTVARNRLVTQGNTGRGLDLLAATVLIADLGISNEWTLGLLFVLILLIVGKGRDADLICLLARFFGLIDFASRQPGFWPPLARGWSTGKVLVSENQVTLDLMDDPTGVLLTSVAVLSLDDVGLVDNQIEISTTHVFVVAANLIAGASVRVADNRFAETWMRIAYSGMSLGLMNTTTDNQATHCLRAVAALPSMRVFRDNLHLIEAFCPNACGDPQG